MLSSPTPLVLGVWLLGSKKESDFFFFFFFSCPELLAGERCLLRRFTEKLGDNGMSHKKGGGGVVLRDLGLEFDPK